MPRALLAIDAGNSRLKFGLFVPSRSWFYRRQGEAVIKVVDAIDQWPCCRKFLAVTVNETVPWSSLIEWNPEGAVVAGSNPRAIDRILQDWPRDSLPLPMVVRDRSQIAVTVDVDAPDKVGLDRLLNAVAANVWRPPGRAVVVVDSGTATTVNFISRDGVFQGGAILPGLEMSAKALRHYTAALPLLPVQDLGGDAPVMPGRNTWEAIRNGLFWGQLGAIRELIRQICRQKGLREPDFSRYDERLDTPWIILTGGGGPVLSSEFPGVLFVPSLGMRGLVLTAWQKES